MQISISSMCSNLIYLVVKVRSSIHLYPIKYSWEIWITLLGNLNVIHIHVGTKKGTLICIHVDIWRIIKFLEIQTYVYLFTIIFRGTFGLSSLNAVAEISLARCPLSKMDLTMYTRFPGELLNGRSCSYIYKLGSLSNLRQNISSTKQWLLLSRTRLLE